MQSCLDEALHFVWNGMGSMPPGLVLIGGTAVALHFNHRASSDLNWLDTTNTLDESSIVRLDAFDSVAEVNEIKDGEDAADYVLRPNYAGARTIDVYFVESDGVFMPELTQPPIAASDNGVLVAHPIDLARMKTMALFAR